MATRIYPLHPIVNDWAEMTALEREELKNELKKNGQRTPILVWKDQVVDGRHRLALLTELKILPKFDTKTLATATEGQMQKHVASLNQYRRSPTRPLSNDEKRGLIKAELIKDASRSNNAIAKLLRVDDKTVASVRREPESTSELPKLDATKGADGKTRRTVPQRRTPPPRANRQKGTEPTKVKEPAPTAPPLPAGETLTPPPADEPGPAISTLEPIKPGNGHASGNGSASAHASATDRDALMLAATRTFLVAVRAHLVDSGKGAGMHQVVNAAHDWINVDHNDKRFVAWLDRWGADDEPCLNILKK